MTQTKATKLTPLPRHNEMVERFHKESDRAAAVLAFAYLDAHLSQLLRSYLRQRSSSVDRLFEGGGPFGTFFGVTRCLYAFAFIDDDRLRQLDALARVRDRFAHDPAELTFDAPEVKELCDGLSLPDAGSPPDNARAAYLVAIALTWATLEQRPAITLYRCDTAETDRRSASLAQELAHAAIAAGIPRLRLERVLLEFGLDQLRAGNPGLERAVKGTRDG
jgi:DNA-binding MltR family transcriptional regulator